MMPWRGPGCFSADTIAGRPAIGRLPAERGDHDGCIGNTRRHETGMSGEEPQPRRTIGSIVAIALVVLILLLIGDIAGGGVGAWLGRGGRGPRGRRCAAVAAL